MFLSLLKWESRLGVSDCAEWSCKIHAPTESYWMALISVIDIWTTCAVTACYQSSWSSNFVSYSDWNIMDKRPRIRKQVDLYTLLDNVRNGTEQENRTNSVLLTGLEFNCTVRHTWLQCYSKLGTISCNGHCKNVRVSQTCLIRGLENNRYLNYWNQNQEWFRVGKILLHRRLKDQLLHLVRLVFSCVIKSYSSVITHGKKWSRFCPVIIKLIHQSTMLWIEYNRTDWFWRMWGNYKPET